MRILCMVVLLLSLTAVVLTEDDDDSDEDDEEHCPKQCRQKKQQETCECIKLPGSDECAKFESNAFASTIDEAMFNFPNPLSRDKKPLFSKPLAAMPFSPEGGSATKMASAVGGECATAECAACKMWLINNFLSANPEPATNASLWKTKQRLQSQLPPGADIRCPSTAPPVSTLSQPNGAPPHATQQRSTRQANQQGASGSQRVGASTVISCDYHKGAPLAEDTRWCGLCSLCWSWRQLPTGYYPQLLNEVTCSSNETACLKGFGQCNPVTRSINVLRRKNDPNGKSFTYEQVTIPSVVSCECQVEYGTSLYSLVSQ